MGLVINQVMEDVSFPDLLDQLGIVPGVQVKPISIHFGGPVEQGRGFVLHSPDYVHESTVNVDAKIFLTATVDILKAIAQGNGPRSGLLALGYAGWGAGQLDAEILQNGWLSVSADPDLIFKTNFSDKWKHALDKLGVDLSLLSEKAGHA